MIYFTYPFRDPRRNKRFMRILTAEARKRGWNVGAWWPAGPESDAAAILIAPVGVWGVDNVRVLFVSHEAAQDCGTPRVLALRTAEALERPAEQSYRQIGPEEPLESLLGLATGLSGLPEVAV